MKRFWTKKLLFSGFFLFAALISLASQEIITAAAAFSAVSQQYGQVADYQAEIRISNRGREMRGIVYYKRPHLFRLNFTDPKDQVIVMDGQNLMLYLPGQSVVMHQSLPRRGEASLATMASAQGLNLLTRGYSISYLDSPNLVPLEAGSRDRVTKFKLEWRSTEEGFRQIIVSVGENGYIRRMEGITKEYQSITYDFINLVVNQNIPDARFRFDPPSSAYTINNFLFEPDN